MQPRRKTDKTNLHGTNSLITAIEKGRLDKVRTLLAKGADVSFRTEEQNVLSKIAKKLDYAKGSTPLHVACLLGAKDAVDLLIKKGADVNAKNSLGETPLDYAILGYNHYDSEYKKKSRARLSIRHTVNKAFSQMLKFEDVVESLVEAGGASGVFVLPKKFNTADASKNTAGPRPKDS